MARIRGEIIIKRPVEAVFDFVCDERNEPRYNPRMLSSELISEDPVGIGSRFRVVLETRGAAMPMTIEFTEFDRPQRLASSTHSSMMDTVGALTFEAVPAGTRMRWCWDVRPRGVLRLMPTVVSVIGRRQERRIWSGLKALLEREGPPASQPGADALGPARGKVLVAYATEHGATKGIAERIAVRLADAGAVADVAQVEQVDGVEGYEAVVLGSGVYRQRWLPEAREFIRRNSDALASRQVWLFSVGSFGDTHPRIGRWMKREPRDIDQIHAAVRPLDYRVFAGVIQPHQWPLPSRLFFKAFGGRFGDNRDWPQIDEWAASIAQRATRDMSRAPSARPV